MALSRSIARSIFIFTCLVFELSPTLGFTDMTPLEVQAYEIESTVLSPFCPGRLLRDCPSSKASDLKKDILNQLAQGQSKDQVIEFLYKTFGPEIRSVPENKGFGRVAWLAPFVVLLVGLAALVLWLRGNSNKITTESPTLEELDPKMKEKIEAEIARDS